MASGHSCPPAGPPAKARPLAKQDFCKIIKQAVAPQAPSPPAAPPRRPPGMPGFGPGFGPPDWRPEVEDKIQQFRNKKQLRESKCDHLAHLRSEPSSSNGPLVATVGTGAPSSRPLAATGLHQAGDPETLGQDVAEHVEKQRQTHGAWRHSFITMKRMHVDCCIRHRLHEELRKLEGHPAGALCHILAGTAKDIKALCIPLDGNNPQKIGDSLGKALEEHPLVCPPSIKRKVLQKGKGMHQFEFADMHNSSWKLLLLAMPEPKNFVPRRTHFMAVLQKWNQMVKMTNTESRTLGNLLCSLTGHVPAWPNSMGGIRSGDPNVGNGLEQAAENHDSGQSAIGDESVRDSNGPLGDDVPEEEALPDCDFGGSDDGSESPDAGAQDDCAMGSDDEAPTPEDDSHVDPDRGGGDLL